MRRIDKNMDNSSKKLLILYIPMVMALSGCMTQIEFTYYVDPTYGRVTYEDLSRPPEPHKWKIMAESIPHAFHSDAMLLDRIHRVLRKSGIAIPVNESYDGELKVFFNCLADGRYVMEQVLRDSPLGPYGGSGNFPLNFEMEIEFREARTTIKRVYEHTVHATMGNVRGPEGVEPLSGEGGYLEAEGRVIDEMMLAALKDIEQEK